MTPLILYYPGPGLSIDLIESFDPSLLLFCYEVAALLPDVPNPYLGAEFLETKEAFNG